MCKIITMKKIIILFAAMSALVSCLGGDTFYQSYVADITFEYDGNVYNKSFKDSLLVLSGFDAFTDNLNPVYFTTKSSNGVLQGGFTLSYLKGEFGGKLEKEATSNDAFRVNALTGAAGTKTYAVFYDNPNEEMMPAHDVEYGYRGLGTFSPSGCFVNNTTLVARKIKENFQDGDKLVLKAIGEKADGTKKEVSITLASYTESKDSIMYNWSVFDLSSLGEVDYIDFEVTSTNPEVPGYFCMDGLLSTIVIDY